MKRNYLLPFLIAVILILSGCKEKDPVLAELIINRKNYPDYIEEIRRGYTGRRYMPVGLWRSNLQDLLIYQEHLKEELYGEDEEQYLYDRAMTLLVIHEFIDSFELFNKYIELTGKRGEVYYQISKNFHLMDRHSSSSVVRYAIGEMRDGRYDPSYQQQIDFFELIGSDFVTVQKKYQFSDDVQDSDEYHKSLQLWENGYQKIFIPVEKENKVNRMVRSETFPYEMIQEIEDQSEHSSYEIDFLIDYYVGVYNQDFQKASAWADRRNVVVEQMPIELPIARIDNMMKAYIGNKQYDEALYVFKANKHKINNRQMSQERFNFLLAVCYAGKRDLDQAMEYLERDVEVTEIFEYTDKRDNIGPQLKGNMTRTIFEYYFVYDEFRNFDKANRYDEVRDIFSEGLNRYRHLEVFNRVK